MWHVLLRCFSPRNPATYASRVTCVVVDQRVSPTLWFFCDIVVQDVSRILQSTPSLIQKHLTIEDHRSIDDGNLRGNRVTLTGSIASWWHLSVRQIKTLQGTRKMRAQKMEGKRWTMVNSCQGTVVRWTSIIKYGIISFAHFRFQKYFDSKESQWNGSR
jgi:hypothetical protein